MNRRRFVLLLALAGVISVGVSVRSRRSQEPAPRTGAASLQVAHSSKPMAADEPAKSQAALASRSLQGRVIDEQGLPVAHALIGSTSAEVHMQRTDAAGQFELAKAPAPGTQIYVVARGFADRHMLLPSTTAPVTVVLVKEAALRGRFHRFAPVDLLVSLCHPSDEPGQDPFCVARTVVAAGSQAFALQRLTAGRYDLFIERGEDPLMKMPVNIHGGQEIDIGEIDTN